MANCSIPNSTPATGRTSTTSSRQSKKLNSDGRFCACVIRYSTSVVEKRRQAVALQMALRARKIRRWTLDVQRWTFSSFWRVKGAWWPSRSSKPSSSRLAGRGRFDSYPLRSFPVVPLAVWLCETRASPTGRRLQWSLVKGGESDVA